MLLLQLSVLRLDLFELPVISKPVSGTPGNIWRLGILIFGPGQTFQGKAAFMMGFEWTKM